MDIPTVYHGRKDISHRESNADVDNKLKSSNYQKTVKFLIKNITVTLQSNAFQSGSVSPPADSGFLHEQEGCSIVSTNRKI